MGMMGMSGISTPHPHIPFMPHNAPTINATQNDKRSEAAVARCGMLGHLRKDVGFPASHIYIPDLGKT